MQQREERIDALEVLLAAAAVEVRAHLEVLEHGHRGEQPPVLGNDRHPLRNAMAGRACGHVVSVEANRATPRLDDPEDRLQRRRLPGRIAAEQADELAFADVQVEVLEDVDLAVVGIDGLELQQIAHDALRPR